MWLGDKVIRKIGQRSLADESDCLEVTDSTGNVECAGPRLPDAKAAGRAHNAPKEGRQKKGSSRSVLLVSVITLHNIPEGLAGGVAFGALSQSGHSTEARMGAISNAAGIGIQNFPEGAAVALPLHQEGLSRARSFVYGSLSGIVEPIFGVLVVLCASALTPFMPWLLSAAAGAMLYVVVEELIPEAHLGEHSHPGTLGVMAGFLVMMVLDTALG